MTHDTELGTYFWRGGKRIELDKEEEFFTAILRDESELNRIRALPGVREVKPVQHGVFKVKVDAAQRDAAMQQWRARNIGGICHHAYRPRNASNTRYYLTDRLVVKFRDDIEAKAIESVLADVQARILREYPGSKNTYLLEVTNDAGMNPIKLANTLASRDDVVYAEPNLINRYQTSYTPSDTHFKQQWHLKAWDGAELVKEASVEAPAAWDLTRGSRDVVVAVVDDGFDLGHPDFTGDGKVVHPKDYVDGDSNPFPERSENDYHGTPCAGVAIAEENGVGVVGVAPKCAFMPVRFPLRADDNALWDIFDYVGARADVISCSWGPPPVNAPLSQLLADKFTQLATTGGRRKKGVVIVFAAGNNNAPLNDPHNESFTWYHPDYGEVTTDGPIVNGEAIHPHVIAVAASTSQNRKAAYSNWGDEVAVCAPSDNFHPIDQNAWVPGRGIWTTDNEQFGFGFTDNSRYTGRFGGTSSATPLVAGVAALVISMNPELTAKEVRNILEETADKIVDEEPDVVLGNRFGTYEDGHSKWFGYGKVNAATAVEHAWDLTPGTRVTNLSVLADARGRLEGASEERLYKFHISEKVRVALTGPEGEDFDLYIRRGAPPTSEVYDQHGFSNSANEKVTIEKPEPGDYYVLVRSYSGAGDFQLRVSLD